jgi:hypothetical protein
MSAKTPKNLYDQSYKYGENRKNLGFDYREKDVLVKKTMMPRLFLNDNVKNFLSYVNDVMVNNIDSVKIIRNFFNYTVKKDDININ